MKKRIEHLYKFGETMKKDMDIDRLRKIKRLFV